ncbi:MAG TPA: Xaa-Pro peptidase family protein [bacterium]|nr:Xaa-Pro peptidase family protein [bacterium]HQP97663.1 Xaa-Pro peptidase family protein [bacterium]
MMINTPYLNRQNLLRQKMERDNLSAFLVTHLPNIRYLCGYTGSHALLILGRERCTIISDGRYQEQISKEVVGAEFILQGQRRDSVATAETLKDYPSGKVGFESRHLSVALHTTLTETCTDRDFVPLAECVEELRLTKEENEIDSIRRALEIAERAFEQVLEDIREGMEERKLAHLLEDRMWREGAEKESFETLVLFGARTSLPHGKPGNTLLSRGDPILMDFGCAWEGYCSDLTRTVFLGDPGSEFRAAYRAVWESQNAAVQAIRPNVPCRDPDAKAREVLQKHGRGNQFIHSLGHGVGLEIHEIPRLSPTEERSLLEGMVITVEPGVYVPDWGGIRIENMVVVRSDGAEVLNGSSTECIVL